MRMREDSTLLIFRGKPTLLPDCRGNSWRLDSQKRCIWTMSCCWWITFNSYVGAASGLLEIVLLDGADSHYFPSWGDRGSNHEVHTLSNPAFSLSGAQRSSNPYAEVICFDRLRFGFSCHASMTIRRQSGLFLSEFIYISLHAGRLSRSPNHAQPSSKSRSDSWRDTRFEGTNRVVPRVAFANGLRLRMGSNDCIPRRTRRDPDDCCRDRKCEPSKWQRGDQGH